MESADLNVVEAEIERRESELIALKVHRNMLVPVNRKLPPEILSQIFLHRRNLSSHRQPYEWITFIHVCHHWRDLAQHTSALWNHIHIRNTMSLECITQIATKSRRGNLTVEVYIDKESMSHRDTFELVKAVAGEIHRADHLRFWVSNGASIWETENVFFFVTENVQGSKLRSLLIWGQYRHWAPTWTNVRQFFSPSMQHLCLRLESLPGMDEVCSALRDMPLLSELELHLSDRLDLNLEPQPEAERPDGPSGQTVELDWLDTIYLHGPVLICTALLESLVFPSTTSVTVRCPNTTIATDPQLHQYQPLIDALLRKFQTTGNDSVRLSSVYVKRSGVPGCVVVDAWTITHTSQVLRDRPEGRKFHVVLPSSIAPKFANALHELLQDVQSMFVDDDSFTDDWAGVVGGMLSLRELMVVGHTCNILPQVLGSLAKDSDMSDAEILEHIRSHPTLPNLQTVVMESPHLVSSWATRDALPLPLLKKILGARKHLGMGPASINITDRVIKSLEHVFRTSGWDNGVYGCLTLSPDFHSTTSEVDESEWDGYCDREVFQDMTEHESYDGSGPDWGLDGTEMMDYYGDGVDYDDYDEETYNYDEDGWE